MHSISLNNGALKIVLGGTAPGLWGETGVPGTRGRPGGKFYS